LCFVLALLAGPVLAHDAKVGDLVIMEPWARATIGQVKTGAAYLTVINHDAAGDRLLAVSTPVAAKAQLHSNIVDVGVMKMRPVEAIDIEAKGSTTLEPGGVHVMLMGVRNPLEEGDARLYVNGEKVARLYGPWFHIGSLPSGRTEVTVTLASNDHHGLAVGDEKLLVTKEIYAH
jgi:copper(I)-binding protein